MGTKLSISVDGEMCGGHGECVVAAPELFDFEGDDDVVTVTQPHPAATQEGAALDAESRCPNAAIRVLRS